MDDRIKAHLNRTYGYEIARLLIDEEMTKLEIKHNLPYVTNNIYNKEVVRIVDPENNHCDIDVFELVPTKKGEEVFTLNNELFSDDDLEWIQDRAETRILDNLAGDEAREAFNANNEIHRDFDHKQSIFYNLSENN